MDILPSYACNFHCPFCIIRQDDSPLLDLDYAEQQLSRTGEVNNIDILGGEPSLLPEAYLSRLIDICTAKLHGERPGMYTNLSRISPLADRVKLTVSFDPEIREAKSMVIQNMLTLDQRFDINMIAGSGIVSLGASYIEKMLSRFRMMKRLCLSSYTHFPGLPDYTPAPEDMIAFIKDLISLEDPERIHFAPISLVREKRRKNYDAVDVAELLPNGRFRYTLKDMANWEEFDTFDEMEEFCSSNDPYAEECMSCRYRGQCLNKYRTDAGCYWDRKIMETIEERLS